LKKIALSICCVVFSASALADSSDIVASNNQIRIQSISTKVNYTETYNGTLDTETGTVPGIALSISAMMGPENIYFQAGYDYASGYTVYTGAPLSGGAFGSVTGTSSAMLSNYGARFGKGYAVQDRFMLTPYAEIGHHEWERGVNYGETYTNYYLGVGVLGQYSPVRRVVLSGNAMLGSTFGSYISVNSGTGVSGFSGSLGNAALYKVGVSADYAFTEQLHGDIAVDYSGFSYGMSAEYPAGAGFVVFEPDSRTNYTTIKFGLGYAF
jgi:hypothetical protein